MIPGYKNTNRNRNFFVSDDKNIILLIGENNVLSVFYKVTPTNDQTDNVISRILIKPNKRAKYLNNLPYLLCRAYEVNGYAYDYRKIKSQDLVDSESRITVICKLCKYEWYPSISIHIVVKSGCPDCKGTVPWTFERLLLKGYQLNGDNYYYGLTKPEDIDGYKSKIVVRCNTCYYVWYPTIGDHIYGNTQCQSCGNTLRWTQERFLIRARMLHGNDYCYDDVIVVNAKDTIYITCTLCFHLWNTTVDIHINSARGCPNCANNIKYTLENFIPKATKKHGDKFSYHLIKDSDINGCESKISVVCTKAGHVSNIHLYYYLHGMEQCSYCFPNSYTLLKFIQKATKMNNKDYDYSLIMPEHIVDKNSEVPIKCNNCKKVWHPKIHKFLYNGDGCPTCVGKGSKGERACVKYFIDNNIPHKREYVMPYLARKRYDFIINYQGKEILVEFDGGQHFKFIPFFHNTEEFFFERQSVDVLKTITALKHNYSIIRIDHKQLNNVSFHLSEALKLMNNTYFSNPELYKYITDKI